MAFLTQASEDLYRLRRIGVTSRPPDTAGIRVFDETGEAHLTPARIEAAIRLSHTLASVNVAMQAYFTERRR